MAAGNPNMVKGNDIATGRPKGSQNKETKQLREFLACVLDNNRPKFKRELNKLEGRDYINAISNILEYCTPKLQRSEVKQEIVDKTTEVFKIGNQTIKFVGNN